MLYRNLELFNLRAVEETEGVAGPRLVRVPEEIRNHLNGRARMQGVSANCGEIRFVTDAPFFKLHLMARRTSTWPQPINPEMRVMIGNLEHSRVELPFDTMTTVPFDAYPVPDLHPEVLRPDPDYGFAPQVWRFVLPAAEIIFGGLETYGYEVRPPRPEEKPAFRCLCHGSSITNSYIEGWPSLMGHMLGIDVLNLGQAGANFLEPEMSDFVAGLDEYDALVLEPGINICGSVTPADFKDRLEHLLHAVVVRHPHCKVALITLFPFGGDPALKKSPAQNPPPVEAYRTIIREAAAAYKAGGYDFTLVEGPEINLPSRCWSADLIHPRYLGNSLIAFRIAEILQRAWQLKSY